MNGIDLSMKTLFSIWLFYFLFSLVIGYYHIAGINIDVPMLNAQETEFSLTKIITMIGVLIFYPFKLSFSVMLNLNDPISIVLFIVFMPLNFLAILLVYRFVMWMGELLATAIP